MPANPKYLTTSKWQRFAKVSAAILGGYFVSMSLHMALTAWFNHVNVIITATYTSFILWVVVMLLTFLFRNGWRAWLLYLFVTIVLVGISLLGKTFNPDFLKHG